MSTLNEMVQNLKTKVSEGKFVDVGEGAARILGVPVSKLRVALAALREEGYHVYRIPAKQSGSDLVTIVRVLTRPGTSYVEAYDALKQKAISSL